MPVIPVPTTCSSENSHNMVMIFVESDLLSSLITHRRKMQAQAQAQAWLLHPQTTTIWAVSSFR